MQLALTVKETCDALSIGVTKCYELINEGKLDTVKIGRGTRVKVSSIHRLLGDDKAMAA